MPTKSIYTIRECLGLAVLLSTGLTPTIALQVRPPLAVNHQQNIGATSWSVISSPNGRNSLLRSRTTTGTSVTSLFQTVTDDIQSTEEDSSTAASAKGNQKDSVKPRFVIEKIGRGSGNSRASSHASYYYGEYVNDKVYRDISGLCVSNFFGTTNSEIQQCIQSSTQKMEMYQSLQPDELRRRRDDVKTASEFFVAYELREATPQDVEEFHREQQIKQQRERELRQKNDNRRQQQQQQQQKRQVHYNGNSNNYYYQVDHSIKSPAEMTSGYDPYDEGEIGPVVMGGTLGGVVGRKQARQENNARSRRPLKRYHQNGVSSSWSNGINGRTHGTNSGWDAFNSRRGRVGGGTRDYYDERRFPNEQPFVVGGSLGDVGPTTRPRNQRRRTSRNGTTGPLFAHRGYHQYQHDFAHFQQPHSSHRSRSNNEQWGVEQPFMVDHDFHYNPEEEHLPRKRVHQQRHQAPPMPHEAQHQSHHTYSSNDGGMNFDYHYSPNDHHQTPSSHNGSRQQVQSRPEPIYGAGHEPHHGHSSSAAAVHESEAPMWVKGNMVGFVEIVHTPYSLGDLDDPEMLTAGMKPHRPVLRNLVVAKNARNAGVGTRLLEACERHVQIHWQMKELVVEVDDLWGEAKQDTTDLNQEDEQSLQPSAVEFYQKKGYDVVLSDPESIRYNEETGEAICQIQCRRDVMRKVFDDNDATTVKKEAEESQVKGRAKESPMAPSSLEALDVDFIELKKDPIVESPFKSNTREDINDPMSSEVELITDPEEGKFSQYAQQ